MCVNIERYNKPKVIAQHKSSTDVAVFKVSLIHPSKTDISTNNEPITAAYN